MPPRLAVDPATVRKVCQLTGEWDKQRGKAAFNETHSQFGVWGTDLGSSFEHAGKLWFLFGDTWPVDHPTDHLDSVAWTISTAPEPGLGIAFVSDVVEGKLRYRPPELMRGIVPLSRLEYEVPIAGFSTGERMYVFHSTDHVEERGRHYMGRTVLAEAEGGDPTDLRWLYDVSVLRDGGKFINVACVVMPDGLGGLPFDGPALLVWGDGRYRESNVHLAAVPLPEVHVRSAWTYFRGREAGSGGLLWGPEEGSATPLFHHPQAGELSVSWIAPLGLWLMLYNALAPRGIVGRVAAAPWGPWSDPVVVFDPGWQGVGYGHFMHLAGSGDDALSDPGHENDSGGEYGPYLIHRFTKRVAGPGVRRAQIYYVMSTWNPYNAVLMTQTVERAGDVPVGVGVPSMVAAGLGPRDLSLEVCAPLSGGGLGHLSRAAPDNLPPAWGRLHHAGSESGRPDANRPALEFVSAAATTVGATKGIIQVAGVADGRVVTWWREREDPWSWHGPFPVVADGGYPLEAVVGNPALIQTRNGARKQNLELVVPHRDGGIHHAWWDADLTIPCWRGAPRFGEALGRIDALTLIQNSVDPGNLELIARVGDRLSFMWRRPAQGGPRWHGPFALAADGSDVAGVSGVPSLMQGTYGEKKRNFELAVPLAAGGIALLWRDLDAPDAKDWVWHRHVALDRANRYDGVSLIQNPFGERGNLELVASRAGGLFHFWRDSSTKAWSGPFGVPLW